METDRETFLETLIQQARVLYLVHDDKGVIIEISPTLASQLGRSHNTLPGTSVQEILHEADPETFCKFCRQASESDQAMRFSPILKRQDGVTFPMRARMKRLGENRCLCIFEQGPRRFEIPSPISHQEIPFQSFIDALPDQVFIKDTQGRYIVLNQIATHAVCQGTDPESLAGTTDFDWLPRERAEEYWREDQSVLEGHVQANRLHRFSNPDGSHVWYSTTKAPLRDTSNKVIGLAGFVRNVTSEQQSRENLQDAEHRFRMLVEESLAGIFIIQDGKLTYCNPRIAQIYGGKPEDLLALPHASRLIDELDRELFTQSIESIEASARRSFQRQLRIRTFHDELRIVDCTAARTTLEGRLCIVGTMLDRTTRLRLEEEVRFSQRMDTAGRLAGSVAHDFNNLLTVIKGVASLIREQEGLGEELGEQLDQILHASDHAIELTRQLLSMGRRDKVEFRVFNLNQVISQWLPFLRHSLRENIEFAFIPDGHPLAIRADESMLEQVLINLLVNARDAMPGGGSLSLSTRTEKLAEGESVAGFPEADPGLYACIEMRDTGTGIAPEIVERLFEPFFTTKPAGEGTGLGMAIVYNIMVQHHGWVQVYSQPGEGTSFVLGFPLADIPTKSSTQRIAKLHKTPVKSPIGGGETILVVEDEEQVRNLARLFLERLGYHVLAAESPEQARELWSAHYLEINLLFTDLVMPGQTNGVMLAQEFLSQKAGLPVIYTSGYQPTDDVPQSEGCVFLPKPFTLDQLAQTVKTLLTP